MERAMGGVSFYMADVTVELEGMGGSSFQMGWPLPGVQEILTGLPTMNGRIDTSVTSDHALLGVSYRLKGVAQAAAPR